MTQPVVPLEVVLHVRRLDARVAELEAASRAVLEMGRGPGAVGCGGDCDKEGCAFAALAAVLSQSSTGGVEIGAYVTAQAEGPDVRTLPLFEDPDASRVEGRASTSVLPSEDEKKARAALAGSAFALRGSDYEYVARIAALLATERGRVNKIWHAAITDAVIRVTRARAEGLSTSAIDELELLLRSFY